MNNQSTTNQTDHIRDHLANERTFLAWIRTSLATLGFGFVLARMGLFLRELPTLMNQSAAGVLNRVELGGEFVLTGAIFLGIGTILALWAAWHYERTRRLIESERFVATRKTTYAVALLVFLSGVLIIGMILARGLLPASIHPPASTPTPARP